MASSSAVRTAEGPNARNRSRGRSLDGQSFIFDEMAFDPLLSCGLLRMMVRGINGSSPAAGAGELHGLARRLLRVAYSYS